MDAPEETLQPTPEQSYYSTAKCNFIAGAAPTVTDDETEGYAPNSVWYKAVVPYALWKCTDATEGAAVWKQQALGTGLPAGSDGQVQFNDSGAFGADSNFIWDDVNKRLGIGVTPTETFHTTSGKFDTAVVIGQALQAGSGAATADNFIHTSGLISFGNDCFLHIRQSALNQWHVHPNDLMLDTTGQIDIGDPAPFGDKTLIRVHDAGNLIWLNNYTGQITIGDVEDVVNGTKLIIEDASQQVTVENADFVITAGQLILPDELANTFFGAPSGGTGVPSFRALVAVDIPNLDAAKIASGVFAAARLGSGTANSSKFLRGDSAWQNYLGANALLSNALLGLVAPGNGLEFGHSTTGYRGTLGAESGTGKPFIAFHAEAGTNTDTYRTRAVKGSVLCSDLQGGFLFKTVATASADNQTASVILALRNDGQVVLGTQASNARFVANALSQADQMTLGTSPGGGGFASTDGNYGTYFGISGSGFGWLQQGRTDGSATAYDFFLQSAGGNVGIGNLTATAKLQVNGGIAIVDGMTAPAAITGYAYIYVDSADGDLKVRFSDGTIKTIVVDT